MFRKIQARELQPEKTFRMVGCSKEWIAERVRVFVNVPAGGMLLAPEQEVEVEEDIEPALLVLALEALETESNIWKWFTMPMAEFRGKTPLEVAKTDEGRKEVEHALGRIIHGVCA
jgi:hypothetical protein